LEKVPGDATWMVSAFYSTQVYIWVQECYVIKEVLLISYLRVVLGLSDCVPIRLCPNTHTDHPSVINSPLPSCPFPDFFFFFF